MSNLSKAAFAQTATRQPDAKSVVDQYFDTCRTLVGKQLGMMRPRCTDDLNYLDQCSVHTDAHINGSVASQMKSIRIILTSSAAD